MFPIQDVPVRLFELTTQCFKPTTDLAVAAIAIAIAVPSVSRLPMPVALSGLFGVAPSLDGEGSRTFQLLRLLGHATLGGQLAVALPGRFHRPLPLLLGSERLLPGGGLLALLPRELRSFDELADWHPFCGRLRSRCLVENLEFPAPAAPVHSVKQIPAQMLPCLASQRSWCMQPNIVITGGATVLISPPQPLQWGRRQPLIKWPTTHFLRAKRKILRVDQRVLFRVWKQSLHV